MPCLRIVMETNLFTRSKFCTLVSNLRLKSWSPFRCFYAYVRSLPGVSTLILLYVTEVEVLAIFIDSSIKGVQITWWHVYDKINELSNFEWNFVFWFNKLQDTSIDFGSKDTSLRTCNSLLIYNWSLNIQFSLFFSHCNASE